MDARQGSDLSHVICEPSASTVIKTYSPDLMVHSYLSSSKDPETYRSHQEEFDQLMDRLHVLVVGPGLGRDTEMQAWAEWTLTTAVKKKIHLVLNADALWLLQNKPGVLGGYPDAILTPNHVEFQRLLKAYSIEPQAKDDEGQLALQLSKALNGCTILQKGPVDVVAREGADVAKVSCQGSPKRCGGQGDILSGLVGTCPFRHKMHGSLRPYSGRKRPGLAPSWLTKNSAGPCSQVTCSLSLERLSNRSCTVTQRIELSFFTSFPC